MGIKETRKIIRVGSSKAITLPSKIVKGEKASIAANRLILIDPRGEISEDELLEFLELYVEPMFWKWIESKRKKTQ
jgi:antitoxin component of MazEF toxin-antitoxin module